MALIKCAECGNEVSDSAASCPKCGAPVARAPEKVSTLGGCLRWGLAGFVALVLLGYCMDKTGSSSSQGNSSSTAPVIPLSGNAAHDQLLALGESKRRTLLSTFLSGSDWKCDSVTDTFFQGRDRNNAAYWNVRCSNGASYSIVVKADSGGSTTVADCADLGVVGVKCFTKF